MRAGLPIVVALSLGVAVVSLEAQRPPDDTNLDAVVAAAAAYVKDYQRALTAILADEDYLQQVVTQTPRDQSMPRARRLQSEVFFMFAPASGDWMAMRDVVSMDGTAVVERPNLREALRTLPPVEVARTFKSYNSRFNLGRASRNFNEPTLSLLLLDDRYRPHVRFTRKGVQKARDGTWVTIAFTEVNGPHTLIRDLSQGPAVSKGEFDVEAATGRVRRARMVTAIGVMTAELTTTYIPAERLGMWVPATFSERYQSGRKVEIAPDPRINLPVTYEEVRGLAKYSNYRRFEVKVIIK
jgi:hypothetical protein